MAKNASAVLAARQMRFMAPPVGTSLRCPLRRWRSMRCRVWRNESENPHAAPGAQLPPGTADSMHALEDPVELVDAVVVDHELAAAVLRVRDDDARREL